MKTIIVYTLISDNTDYYYEQALISVYSLRVHNPNAIVYIVVDQNTYNTLKGNRKEIYKYVTDIISIDAPCDYNKMQRSRYLKTNLRKFIKGNYLFIDCDTIISQSLKDIDKFDGDLGLVADLNGELFTKDTAIIERCIKAGFQNCYNQPYYNSGIMLVKDTPLTHHFYDEWNKNWLQSMLKGVPYDQPALCQTNISLNYPIKELSGIWNCQFKFEGYRFLSEAKIMHYYFNGSVEYKLAQQYIFNMVKEKGYIDSTTEKMIKHPQTTLYTYLTINEEILYDYTSSPLIYIFHHRPSLFRFIEQLSTIILKPHLLFSNIKNNLFS